jgi:hypothetical protein
VVLAGKLRLVENREERTMAIEKMAEVGRQKLSENFLIAHGFSKGSNWGDFAVANQFLIIKLEVIEKMGLKSP